MIIDDRAITTLWSCIFLRCLSSNNIRPKRRPKGIRTVFSLGHLNDLSKLSFQVDPNLRLISKSKWNGNMALLILDPSNGYRINKQIEEQDKFSTWELKHFWHQPRHRPTWKIGYIWFSLCSSMLMSELQSLPRDWKVLELHQWLILANLPYILSSYSRITSDRCRQNNPDRVRELFEQISDPSHSSWRKFVSRSEVDELLKPMPDAIGSMMTWLAPFASQIQLTQLTASVKVAFFPNILIG